MSTSQYLSIAADRRRSGRTPRRKRDGRKRSSTSLPHHSLADGVSGSLSRISPPSTSDAMESPGSPYASSSPKRSQRLGSPSLLQDDKDKQTNIRFLVSNVGAGCIIGKGGSTISEFQTLSRARIQLSRNQEFFPGTSDRIILISGAVDEVMKATELVLEKLLAEAEESNDVEIGSKVRLVVPNSSCGAIIGKGGSTIKSFIDESQASIKVSPLDQNFVGLNDRLVTIMGSLDERLRAILLILSKLTEEGLCLQSIASPYPYPVGYGFPSAAYNSMNYGVNGAGGKYPINKGMSSQMGSTRMPARTPDARETSRTIGISDEFIGAVVGRGGRNVMEISQVSGARIKISDRGDFISGTSDRKVTITGLPESIEQAESMIMHKISSVSPAPRRDESFDA